MILILGGTTEGRIAAQTLEEAGKTYFYSTRGDEQEICLHHGVRQQGALDETGLYTFCRQHGIRLMVDAAHPFAEQLHQTVEQVSLRLGIPVVRLERIFPTRDEVHLCWCQDYEEAVLQIRQAGIGSLLALTGVQTIGKLKALWQEKEGCRCRFRILDRDSSRAMAARQGFPMTDICYYHPEEDERTFLARLKPDAILTKESGTSGGFCEKVDAALELGIRVFVIRRPETPRSFYTANGEHGLRRMVEKLLPDFYPLHSGLTTGTCATAAVTAATYYLLTGECLSECPVILPDGETIPVQTEVEPSIAHSTNADGCLTLTARASVTKDAGDDPDITDGMRICATVTATMASNSLHSAPRETAITLQGGEGVGTVTMPGLGLPLGAPAINDTPRKMLEENVHKVLKECDGSQSVQSLCITVSVPGGEEIARRTFNPRIGVVGGISIIGTSGIVKPFSSEAFINSIRKALEVAQATGSHRIVINSGAKSEKFLHRYYPELPLQAFVHYGNYIGETIRIAAELGIGHLTLGLMIGKAVKLAEGHLDTHSKHVTMNRTFVLDVAREAGCSNGTLEKIKGINMARELWDILPAEEQTAFAHRLTVRCARHCAPLLPHGELTVLLITETGNILS